MVITAFCSVKIALHSESARSHIRIVWSELAEANNVFSGLILKLFILLL